MAELEIKKSTENSGRNNVYGINNAKHINRLGAFILDMILMLILFVCFIFVGTAICKTDQVQDQLIEKYAEHGVATKSEEEPYEYVVCEYTLKEDGSVDENDPCYLAYKSFAEDEEAVRLQNLFDNTILVISLVSSLLAVLIIEFIMPLVIKNNKTIGYWAMHTGLISKECIKPKTVQLFARAVIGRWALEIVPLIYTFIGLRASRIGILLIAAILICEVVSFFATKNHVWLHDFVANTVPVDADTQYFAKDMEELEEMRKGA